MINDILDFYQISNGKLGLNNEYFSLWDVIIDVSKLIKFQAKLKGLKFIRDNKIPEASAKAFVKSDPNRLKQVMLNLLGNALKFTSVGSITISLELFEEKSDEIPSNKEVPEGGNYRFMIKVTDTGIGIKKEDQSNLFKLFGKIENSKSKTLNKSGIGLGLCISQSIVKLLNKNEKDGEIKVESEPGKGSCFYFPLKPWVLKEDEENISPELKEPKSHQIYVQNTIKIKFDDINNQTAHDQKETVVINENLDRNILIVDDDQINLLIARTYLKNEPLIKHDTVCGGLQALEKIKEMANSNMFYDVIFMDCNMPILDGFETTKLIKDMINHNIIPKVVIIACTANTSQADKNYCYQAGMDDVLTKPFSKIEFLALMKKYSKIKNK